MLTALDHTIGHWLRTLPSPRTSALCAPNVETVTQLLLSCETECSCRHQLPTNKFVPTRLLDLEAWETTKSIRLIQTSLLDITEPIRYVALSYCWGPKHEADVQLRTTSATLHEYSRCIKYENLTPVIRDAVISTRAFALRYLWIDALCIVQGSHEDWARESKRMDLVYYNAYFTICTLASSTCVRSFLDRKTSVVVPFKSAIRPDTAGIFHLRYLPQLDYGRNYDPFALEMDSGAWRSRAWTYQEEFLSARKVFFGHSRLVYACPTREWTEPTRYGTASCTTLADMLRIYDETRDLEELYNDWVPLLSAYGRRRLTYPKDAMPAISGLAKKMASVTGDKYIAGLWRSDLARQLLWKQYRGDDPASERYPPASSTCNEHTGHEYVCPSWSCVSRMYFFHPQFHTSSFAKFGGERSFRPETLAINAWASPEDPILNPWGRIASACLRVEARFFRVGDEDLATLNTDVDGCWIVDLGSKDHFYVAMCRLDSHTDCLNQSSSRGLTLLLLASSFGTDHGSFLEFIGDSEEDEDEDDGEDEDGEDCENRRYVDRESGFERFLDVSSPILTQNNWSNDKDANQEISHLDSNRDKHHGEVWVTIKDWRMYAR